MRGMRDAGPTRVELPAAEPAQQILDLIDRLNRRRRVIDRRRQCPNGDIYQQANGVFWILRERA